MSAASPLESADPVRTTEAPGPASPPARFRDVSRVLRAAGSFALIAAMSTFLWQQWQIGSDLLRAGTLLAHTVGLTLAGLFCGLGARDGRAARTFLGLASASLPVVACVAGGLLYSQLSLDSGPVAVAGYATWVAPSAGAALAAAALALATAVPVSVLTMGVFARRQLGWLAAAFVGGLALLLVPTRDPDAIALLAAGGLAGLSLLEFRVLRREHTLSTLEGGLARALVLAPPVLLLARSLLHYELSPLLHALCWFAVALALTGVSWSRRLPDGLREFARWAALIPAARAGGAVSWALLEAGMTQGLVVPVAAGAFGAQLAVASLAAGRAGWGHAFRSVAALGFAAACALNLAFAPGVVASLLAGVAGLGVLAWGTLRASRSLQLSGAAVALLAVAVHVQHAIAFYHWNRWGSLALLGVAVIVAASGVERFGARALARLEHWQRRLGPEE